MACDAKLNFDDNAEWRQPETFKFRDYTQEDAREVRIMKYWRAGGNTGGEPCLFCPLLLFAESLLFFDDLGVWLSWLVFHWLPSSLGR